MRVEREQVLNYLKIKILKKTNINYFKKNNKSNPLLIIKMLK